MKTNFLVPLYFSLELSLISVFPTISGMQLNKKSEQIHIAYYFCNSDTVMGSDSLKGSIDLDFSPQRQK